LALLFISNGQSVIAQEDGQSVKPLEEMTIADIMKEAHKKPVQLLKKVATGQADDAEKQRLVDLYKAMKKLQPPKGDADSWNEKNDLLISAATAVAENKAEAQASLTKAANCKSCHDAHKE
jgi:hypothetical protein